MQEILGLVRRCVTDYDMIQEGETVAVGVSGGKDSLVTLTALALSIPTSLSFAVLPKTQISTSRAAKLPTPTI